MNPFDPAGWGQMWGAGAGSFLDAQKRLFEAAMKTAPEAAATMADTAGLASAEAALAKAMAEAEAIAEMISASLNDETSSDPVATRLMERVFHPRGWLREAAGTDGAFGLPPGFEGLLAALAKAWTRSRCLRLERETFVLDAWRLAADRFAETLAARAGAGETPDDPTALMGLWVAIADEALLSIQRSERFLANQRGAVAADADLRLAQASLAAVFAETYGLPTRREMDDVHRAIVEMRREMRTLEAKVHSSGAPGEGPQGGRKRKRSPPEAGP